MRLTSIVIPLAITPLASDVEFIVSLNGSSHGFSWTADQFSNFSDAFASVTGSVTGLGDAKMRMERSNDILVCSIMSAHPVDFVAELKENTNDVNIPFVKSIVNKDFAHVRFVEPLLERHKLYNIDYIPSILESGVVTPA